MTKVLILGGTGWLSGRIALEWLRRGAAVTCLARGARPVPEGARLVVADRDHPDAYAELTGRWDHVIDISSRAVHVAAALRALSPSAARWTYVSSMSVYADDTVVDADESARRHPPAAADDADDYAAEKVAAEDHVHALGDRALIIRPGLIVGDGDPSDRFGYWAAAFLRAGNADVLLPPTQDLDVQVIDVDDLANFVVETSATGAVNAIGRPHPLAEVLTSFRAVTGHTGPVVAADEQWLRAHDVEYWAGPRSLPLWLPSDMPGVMARSFTSFVAHGGTLRPLHDTIARVVADERRRGVDRERRAGLTRTEEEELLAALADERGRENPLR